MTYVFIYSFLYCSVYVKATGMAHLRKGHFLYKNISKGHFMTKFEIIVFHKNKKKLEIILFTSLRVLSSFFLPFLSYIHTRILYVRACIHTYCKYVQKYLLHTVHVYIHTHSYIHTQIHIYIHIHTHIHTYIHTYVRTYTLRT